MALEPTMKHSLESEQAVLGSLLIDPDILRDVLSTVREEDFQLEINREIFRTARGLFRAGHAVDAVTIRERTGGQYSDYLLQLMEITPTSANWREYAEIMREKAVLARVSALARALDNAPDVEACRPLSARLAQLLTGGRNLNAWTVSQLLDSFFKSQDPDAPKPEYIRFGLDVLDEGSYIEPGDVVIIGGYPSAGKTVLSLQAAWHMARKYRVGFFSLETNHKKIRDRLIAHAAQIGLPNIKTRNLNDQVWESMARQQAAFAKRDFTMIEAAGMSATDIESASGIYGFQVIFIDYVQLVVPERAPGGTRSEQMAGVSIALHNFAQRTGTLVVELAQLARPDKKTGNQPPTMHDLKESGQFEQDADVILLLYHPGKNEQARDGTTLEERKHRWFKLAKNKEGQLITWPMCFDGAKQTFFPLPGYMEPEEAPKQMKLEELPQGEETPF